MVDIKCVIVGDCDTGKTCIYDTVLMYFVIFVVFERVMLCYMTVTKFQNI